MCADPIITCDLAHSRTDTMRSWVGWMDRPDLPMGFGSVVIVSKGLEGSRRPKRPFQSLFREAVLGTKIGIKGLP